VRLAVAPEFLGRTSSKTNTPERARRHTRGTHTHTHTHGLLGEQSVIHTLLGSRENFKGVSIFRPEQLDPSEMNPAHQSPPARRHEYNGCAGCFGERGSPSQSN